MPVTNLRAGPDSLSTCLGRKKPFIPKEWRVNQQSHVCLSCAQMTTGVVPGSDGRDESARKASLEKFTQGRNT